MKIIIKTALSLSLALAFVSSALQAGWVIVDDTSDGAQLVCCKKKRVIRKRPKKVHRGSSITAMTGPLSSSAFLTILRNFNMLKGLPPTPIRLCLNKIFPLLVNFIKTAMNTISQPNKARPESAPRISIVLFAMALQP